MEIYIISGLIFLVLELIDSIEIMVSLESIIDIKMSVSSKLLLCLIWVRT